MTLPSGTFETTIFNDVRDLLDLRDIALPGEQFRRDGEVARLGETTAEVLDVFVDMAKISSTTRTTGKGPPFSGIAR